MIKNLKKKGISLKTTLYNGFLDHMKRVSSLEKSGFSSLLTFKNSTFLKKSIFLENLDIVKCSIKDIVSFINHSLILL
jgi:hypothetical protein